MSGVGGDPLPTGLSPMLAATGTLPEQDDGWAYEVKWDGVRALAAVEGGRLTLTTRRGNDVTSHYPELGLLANTLDGHQALLDGEVVAFDEAGRTDFGLLQSRMHVTSPSQVLRDRTPVRFLAFDLLHLDGVTLLTAGYDERRSALDTLAGLGVDVPDRFLSDGHALAEATRAQGLEGLVAKRRDSRYEPGRRSETWRKIKHVRRTSAVVMGWKPGAGVRAGSIGSLLLGVYGTHGLEYAGHVGTGFTDSTLRVLGDLLEPLRIDQPATEVPRADARSAVWVRPVLVAEIDYTEWTREGRLRHPSFKGLRDDLEAAGVVRQ
ncbi:MAG: non-homologous end-joining DNA ligase [Actinomycetota bacterium]|nr:non-homologous end-joining DNA ligase [Actinomycetota bacterium]